MISLSWASGKLLVLERTELVTGAASIGYPSLASAEAGRARLVLGGVSDQAEPPDLVLTGKVIMGGVAIIYKKTDSVSEAV